MGVIGFDAFEQVQRAPYDTQPELGLLEFMKFISKFLGKKIWSGKCHIMSYENIAF